MAAADRKRERCNDANAHSFKRCIQCGDRYHWKHAVDQTAAEAPYTRYYWLCRCAARLERVPVWLTLHAKKTTACLQKHMARAKDWADAVNTPWYNIAVLSGGFHADMAYRVITPD